MAIESAARWAAVAAALGLTVGCAAQFPEIDAPLENEVERRTGYVIDKRDSESSAPQIDSWLEDGLEIDDAVRIAMLNNPVMHANLAELGVAAGELVTAASVANPVLEGSFLDSAESGSWTIDLGLSQSLVSLLQMPARRRAAEAGYALAQTETVTAVVDLIGAARLAWIEAAASAEHAALLTAIVDVRTGAVRAAESLYAAGNVSQRELLFERWSLAEAELALVEADKAQVAARETLNATLGLWGERTGWLISGRLGRPGIPDVATLEAAAVDASLALDASRRRIEALAQQLGIEEASSIVPDLEIGIEAEREEGHWSAGPSFEIELPLTARNKGRVFAARSALEAERANYSAMAIEIRAAARTLAHAYQSDAARATYVADTVIPIATGLMAETGKAFNAMEAGVFDLIDARRRELDSARADVDARRDLWMTWAAVEQLLDGGSIGKSGGAGGADTGLGEQAAPDAGH